MGEVVTFETRHIELSGINNCIQSNGEMKIIVTGVTWLN